VAVSHSFGSFFAWVTGGVLTGVFTDHLYAMLAIYLCLSTVFLCLLDFPEKMLPRGTVDIVGFSHNIFHIGIIAGVFGLWKFFSDF